MDTLADIKVTFFQECEDQLTALESGLMAMEGGDTSSETVNAVFRSVHSIKGGAGAFKLTDLVAFAHIFETLLDHIRSGTHVADGDTMRLMLRAADILADLVRMSRDGEPINPASYAPMITELEGAVRPGGNAASNSPDDGEMDIDFTPTLISFGEPASSTFRIHFRPLPELYRKANDPLALLRELEGLGQLTVRTETAAIPSLEEYEWNSTFLSFIMTLVTEKDESAVREVFEFVDGDCDLAIALEAPAESLPLIDLAPEPAVTEVLPAAAEPKRPEPQVQAVKPAEEPAQPAAAAKAQAPLQTIRVDLERVDRLINLVGELVINQAMLSMRFAQLGAVAESNVASSLEELETLTREIQESVMAIRAQPVKSLFQRMSRIVREVADSTGKSVRLKTDGEATEIDKTVIELLADPLTHMIRNAVDHGLEKPEEREAAGKVAEGTVRLSAAHRSGRVVITVGDDGAGINRPKVLEKAIEKGLVPAAAQLSDAEIDNLLFLPGFSTANSVSSISGRGVGMDVVKRSIQALGGRISISSVPRQGTTFSLSLPLTLAVLDGIIVSVAGETFVIPLTAVVETLQPEPGMLLPLGQGSLAMRVRDMFVPLVDVGYELMIRGRSQSGTTGVTILVETDGQSRCALLVDSIQDQRQVVIKSLETNYGKVRGIAAATILGDGRVAMILDVDSLVRGRDGASFGRDFEHAKAG